MAIALPDTILNTEFNCSHIWGASAELSFVMLSRLSKLGFCIISDQMIVIVIRYGFTRLLCIAMHKLFYVPSRSLGQADVVAHSCSLTFGGQR